MSYRDRKQASGFPGLSGGGNGARCRWARGFLSGVMKMFSNRTAAMVAEFCKCPKPVNCNLTRLLICMGVSGGWARAAGDFGNAPGAFNLQRRLRTVGGVSSLRQLRTPDSQCHHLAETRLERRLLRTHCFQVSFVLSLQTSGSLASLTPQWTRFSLCPKYPLAAPLAPRRFRVISPAVLHTPPLPPVLKATCLLPTAPLPSSQSPTCYEFARAFNAQSHVCLQPRF